MGGDLRKELGIHTDPEFDLELPAGWARGKPDQETLEQVLSVIKRRMMDAHRPDMYAQVRTLLSKAFEEMRRNSVIAYFAASSSAEDALYIPASMTASIRHAGHGESLDGLVSGLVRNYGATALRGDKRTVRAEREKTVRIENATIINHYVTYLTPIPGANRRRALQLVASFGRELDSSDESPGVAATRELFDGCVATLRWRRAGV